MRYVVDTSLINKLVNGSVSADELPNDGEFVASHVQIDEINRTKDVERRAQLFLKFTKTIDKVMPTESFILGVSRLGEGKLGDGVSFAEIKKMLDSQNGGKPNNLQDALITEIAMVNGYVLLTADLHLSNAAQLLGIRFRHWAVGRGKQ
jgi:hypothetical protein